MLSMDSQQEEGQSSVLQSRGNLPGELSRACTPRCCRRSGSGGHRTAPRLWPLSDMLRCCRRRQGPDHTLLLLQGACVIE